ncbi:alkaline phosphatase [Kroppenstedtia pulmonis]|uniref:Alkaline phosphatase n=1 Tax=Kroppenstedtia pulmonis TaxID=1380685 RepID=A0A7D4C6G5_9BACL|nr:alkaline phosphatase [Kroppenstedtia pulmonis]QKG84416.1 alkaline phosphatase [Kroppenstedtia pulmonis]
MKRYGKKLAGILLSGLLIASIPISNQEVSAKTKKPGNHPKNIIFMIGDGMGVTQVSAAAYMKGEGYEAGKLALNTFKQTGMVTTHSRNNIVTDSAAAGTALASGYKTDNGVLGKVPKGKKPRKDEKYHDVPTVLDHFQKRGKSTGLVSTTRITHATPASFAAHVDHRDQENEIAVQLLGKNVDVLLGGGRRHFLPKQKGGNRDNKDNLLETAKNKGYSFVEDKQGLKKSDSSKLLGLFNDSHLSYELDRRLTKEPSLKEMTRKSLDVLDENKKGFFLMIEGGRIDHAGHANDPASIIQDTLAFDEAVREALEFAKKDRNTLVVVTADHETGGMSIGAKGLYSFDKDTITKVKGSSEYIASQLDQNRSNIKEVMAQYTGITKLSAEEEKNLRHTKNPEQGIAKVISDRSLIGWATTGHTASHAPIYAYGPQSQSFTGTMDNTDIPKIMMKRTR